MSTFQPSSPIADNSSESAQIFSYQVNGKQLQFAVESSGCTFYSSFEIKKGQLSNSVEIKRIQPDKCTMRKHLIELTYPLGGLGLDFNQGISVVNPVNSGASGNLCAGSNETSENLRPKSSELSL